MFKKSISLALVWLLIQTICVAPASAFMQTDGEAQQTAKLKARINEISRGEKKRASVTRRDGVKLAGRISEVKEDSFVIIDEKIGTTTTVAYSDVTQVNSKGKGLTTGAKVAIGAGLAAVVLVLIIKPLGGLPFPPCTSDTPTAPCTRR